MVNFLFLFLVSISVFADLPQDKLDLPLRRWAQGAREGQVLRVIVMAKGPNGAVIQKPEKYNRASVVRYFKDVSRQSLLPILTRIQNGQLQGVRVLHSYWINATFVADVNIEGLKHLSQEPFVSKIYLNDRYKKDPYRVRGVGRPARNPYAFFNQTMTGQESASERYNFASLGVDKLYKEFPKISGTGVTVGLVDSGVDVSHPALKGKVLKFYNAGTHTVSAPVDQEGHGTHVAGIIVGGDRDRTWIGMAPGAKLVAAGVFADYDAVLEGMQWFLEGGGEGIKVINCSWNTTDAQDQEVFYRAITAWEAAGILPVFSAGNSGPKPGSITPPHEHPAAFDVAAFDSNGNIADYSSRGPAVYKGQQIQKPDIAAPGTEIDSTVIGGKFEKRDGTSSATPHVTGAAALLLQVNPTLTPAQLKQILVQTTTIPRGGSRGVWNPNWGYGYLNIYAAVKAVMGMAPSPMPTRIGFHMPSEMLEQMIFSTQNR